MCTYTTPVHFPSLNSYSPTKMTFRRKSQPSRCLSNGESLSPAINFGFLFKRNSFTTPAAKLHLQIDSPTKILDYVTVNGSAELLRMALIDCPITLRRDSNSSCRNLPTECFTFDNHPFLKRRQSTGSMASTFDRRSLNHLRKSKRSSSIIPLISTENHFSSETIVRVASSTSMSDSDHDSCDARNGSEQESPSASPRAKHYSKKVADCRKKKCASCKVKKTPYWREGWDKSVLLCNACGIRYQKYKKFCLKCRCIARKDEKGRLHCPECQDKL